MSYSARDVVDVLLDARADLVLSRVPRRATHAIDRQLAGLRRLAPATRDEAHRAAVLLLELRDRHAGRDAAALLRAAQLLANESRTLEVET